MEGIRPSFISRNAASLTAFGITVAGVLAVGIVQVGPGEGCAGTEYAPTVTYDVGVTFDEEDASVETVEAPVPEVEVDVVPEPESTDVSGWTSEEGSGDYVLEGSAG